MSDLGDVTVSSPVEGESLLYDRASSSFLNRRVDHPDYVNLDIAINNISAASGDHLLYTYAWSDLQEALINFALGHLVAYRLRITTDQAFASVKLRQTGSSGTFTGTAAFSAITSGAQTATATAITASLLSPSLDIYINRSTSARVAIPRLQLFLYLYK